MLHKTRGIVLHNIKYSESSIIVYIYTEHYGRLSFIINNIRSKKSAIRLNLFHPLSVLEIDATIKPNSNLQRIKDIKNLFNCQNILENAAKSSIAIFIAEILYRTIREEESNNLLFQFLLNSIQYLDVVEEGFVNFHLLFLVQLTRYVGISPDLTFLIREIPNFNDRSESTGDFQIFENLDLVEIETMKILLTISFSQINELKIERKIRVALLDKIIQYYIHHFSSIKSIKSLEVLKEVFK